MKDLPTALIAHIERQQRQNSGGRPQVRVHPEEIDALIASGTVSTFRYRDDNVTRDPVYGGVLLVPDAAAKRLRENPTALVLHPDDAAELRRTFAGPPEGHKKGDAWEHMPVVEDSGAPRLGRRLA